MGYHHTLARKARPKKVYKRAAIHLSPPALANPPPPQWGQALGCEWIVRTYLPWRTGQVVRQSFAPASDDGAEKGKS